MKKHFFVLLSLVLAYLMTNCENEEKLSISENIITNQLNKVETDYVDGAIKIENMEDGTPKVETIASEELRAKIEKELEESYSKQTTYLKTTSSTGVFKYGSCGSYKLLEINMDTEDSSPNSYTGGNVGDSYVSSSNNNVYLKFCVMPGIPTCSYQLYALQLGNSWASGDVFQIQRYFDSEDTNNQNSAYYDGTKVTEFGDSKFGSNITLNWIECDGGNNYSGINYGLLGSITGTPSKNYIRTDDEDSNNANALKIKHYNGSSWVIESYDRIDHGAILDNIIVGGTNTVMYISYIPIYSN